MADKRRNSKRYTFDSKAGAPNIFKDWDSRNKLFEGFPYAKVKKLTKKPDILSNITGPNDVRHPIEAFTHYACGRTISTYPHIPGKPLRDGDPVCDSYCIQILEENSVIMCITDGCNWGVRPMEASNRAKNAFVEYLRLHQHKIEDLNDAGHQLLNAIACAHQKIIEGKDVWDAGTTTLCGGLLLPLDTPSGSKKEKQNQLSTSLNSSDDIINPKWAFVCVSIGDCKAYWYSSRKKALTDITAGNRKNVYDARDCGGRLGPYVGQGEPDLRNLSLYTCFVEEHDLIILVSDGVHDNLDPQVLGKSPKDIVENTAFPVDEWSQIEKEDQVEKLKTLYMCKLMLDSVEGRDEDISKLRSKISSSSLSESDEVDLTSPLRITNRLMKHCLQVTSKGREWMEQNPKDRLPSDYTAFPGKMDHSSVAIVRVSHFDQILTSHASKKK